MELHPDPHGQAALMVCESLLILLIESGAIQKNVAVEALNDIIDVKQEIAGTSESVVVSMASIGLLRALAQSISALPINRPVPVP